MPDLRRNTVFPPGARFPAADPKAYYTAAGRRVPLAHPPLHKLESALAKPPNYKQEKKRREEMQKKKNDAKQLEKAARKENAPRPLKP